MCAKTLFTQLAVLLRRCNVLQHHTTLLDPYLTDSDPICVWTEAVLTQGRDAKTNNDTVCELNSIISDDELVIPSKEKQDIARNIL